MGVWVGEVEGREGGNWSRTAGGRDGLAIAWTSGREVVKGAPWRLCRF